MSEPQPELAGWLADWLDARKSASLEAACEWVKHHPIDVGALLDWVDRYGADDEATTIANRRLRFALGLPVIPGPVCRR